MYKFLTKNGQTIAFLLGVAIVVIFLLSVIGGMGTFDGLAKEDQYKSNIFNFGLSGAIALVVIAAIAMVAFGLWQVISNLKGSLKGIIGFAALAGIFLVAYSSASGTADAFIEAAIQKFRDSGNGDISAGNLKFIGGGISTVGVLLALAVGAFVISEIRNFFK